MTEEQQLVRDVFSSVFLGSPKEPVWEYADRNVFLDERQSAQLARYDSEETPWAREIQDAPRDPDTHEVAAMKASRTGVSEAAYNVIRWMPKHFPGNVLVTLNSVEKCRDVFRRDLIPSVSTLAKDCLTGDPNDITSSRIRLKNMTIMGGGSGSPSLFRGEWYRFALLDEAEDHQVLPDGTTYDLAKSRFATVADYTLMTIGKPQNEGGVVHDVYLRGSQEKWMVPCPRCEKRIELLWSQMRYLHCKDEYGEWDLEAMENNVWYQCQLCDGKIEEWEKHRMVADGEWQPTPKKDRMKLKGKSVAREPGIRSFHISAIYSPFPQVTWGKLAQMWVACAYINVSEGKKDDFRKDKLGLPIAPKELHLVEESIAALCGGYTETVYYDAKDAETGAIETRSRTEVHGERFSLCYDRQGSRIADLPCDPIFLTITVDKQGADGGFLKYTVCAWQADGQCWLIDFGRLADEHELLAVMPKRKYRYRDEERGIDREHTIWGGVMDRAWRSQEVYRCCQTAQDALGWNLYPALGWGTENEKYMSDSLAEKEDTLPGGVKMPYYRFHDHSVKVDFYFGTIQDRSEPRFWMPHPCPQEVAVELVSEYWDSGKQRFVHPEDAPPNDYGDCLKMQKGVVWPILSAFID